VTEARRAKAANFSEAVLGPPGFDFRVLGVYMLFLKGGSYGWY